MSRSDTARIDRGQELVGQGVERAYTQADFSRFPPSRLEQMNPGLRGNPATAQSAFLGNLANPFAGGFQQQRMPGAQYANYERAAPNVGGPMLQPQVPPGYVPPGTQPEVIKVYPDGEPVGDEEPLDLSNATEDQILQNINESRIAQGQEPFGSMEEFRADLQRNIGNIIGGEGGFNPFGGMSGIAGGIGMAEGGIASVQPQYMAGGGIMAALGGLGRGIGGALTGAGGAIGNALQGIGGGIGRGIEALGGMAQQANENYQANQKKREKRLEEMTREELIELIKTGKKPSGNSGISGLQQVTDRFIDAVSNRPAGGTNSLRQMGDPSMLGYSDPMRNATPTFGGFADGGDVEYPRMNGPISGPGTETSDDIPAMLSDGEFVVNAKAVRGIGRLKGAGKTKAEQRQEGARMMYALQRAGEKAMRKA